MPKAAGPSTVVTVIVPSALQSGSSSSKERRVSSARVPSPSTSATITSWPTECLRAAGGTFRHEPARGDDAHPVGQGVGFLEVLGGQEDRHAQLTVEPPDLGPDGCPAAGGRVRSWARRETAPLGCGPRRRRDPDAASFPPNTCRYADRWLYRCRPGRGPRESHPDLRGTQPVEAALQREQFAPGLTVVNGRVLERNADPDADRSGILRHVVPGHRGRPGTGLEQRAEDADHRRLAGPVWSQESVDLPPPNAEVETVDCDRRTETTDQPTVRTAASPGSIRWSDLAICPRDILDQNHSYL